MQIVIIHNILIITHQDRLQIMNPLFNQKYKTTLCRHWQTSQSCSIGVRCVFAHGEIQLRNTNDPITISQSVLSDPKMINCLSSNSLGDIAHINAMVAARQLQSLKKETQNLKKAFNQTDDKDAYKNTLNTAKQYMNKQHYDLTSDPVIEKKIQTQQLRLMAKQILKLQMHPIIRCKVEIAQQLVEADNINAAAVILDQIMMRPSASERQQNAYERIIEMAGELMRQIIAEEKVKYQKMQRDQEMLLRKQYEKGLQAKSY